MILKATSILKGQNRNTIMVCSITPYSQLFFSGFFFLLFFFQKKKKMEEEERREEKKSILKSLIMDVSIY